MGFNTFPCNPYPISTEELNKGNNDDLNTRVAALESDVSDLNSNKANQITIAPFFNAETAYEVGDLVYYNGLSYRCTNDHEGEWDADDFAATTVSNELATLKSGLTNLTKVETVTATVVTGANVTINSQDLVRYGNVISGQMSITTSADISAWTNIIDLGVNSKTKGGFVGFNQGVAKPFYTEKNSRTICPFVSLPSGETYIIWVNVYV